MADAPDESAIQRPVQSHQPTDPPDQSLAMAQRWYLYRLHHSAGFLARTIVSFLLLSIIGLFAPPGDQANLLPPVWYGAQLLAWFIVAGGFVRGWRGIITGDPRHRFSTLLFAMGYLLPGLALLSAAMVLFILPMVVRRALDAQEGASLITLLYAAPPGAMIAATSLAFIAQALLGLLQIEHLMSRASIQAAPRSSGSALLIGIATACGAILLLAAVAWLIGICPTSGPGFLRILLIWLIWLSLALLAIILLWRILRLRSRLGVLLRTFEPQEPGPFFEPVSGP